MSFFEPIREAEPEPAFVEYRPRPWAGPPDNEMPVAVPLDLLLARTEDVAVFISDARVYSTGFTFSLLVVSRGERTYEDRHGFMIGHGAEGEDDARFAVAFADGQRAELERHLGGGEPAIVLGHRGGGGGGRRWDSRHWVWPLPPEGPLTFAFRWLRAGIEETLVEVDSAPLRDAAARAVELWPDDRPEPPRRDPGDPGWTAYAP